MIKAKNWLVVTLYICVNYSFAQVRFSEVNIGCLNLTQLRGNIVITEQGEYEKLYSYLSPHPSCPSYFLPEIDFQTEILVGIDADAGGCREPELKLEVIEDDTGCVVSLTVKSIGMCKALFQKRIWIIVKNLDCTGITFITKSN